MTLFALQGEGNISPCLEQLNAVLHPLLIYSLDLLD